MMPENVQHPLLSGGFPPNLLTDFDEENSHLQLACRGLANGKRRAVLRRSVQREAWPHLHPHPFAVSASIRRSLSSPPTGFEGGGGHRRPLSRERQASDGRGPAQHKSRSGLCRMPDHERFQPPLLSSAFISNAPAGLADKGACSPATEGLLKMIGHPSDRLVQRVRLMPDQSRPGARFYPAFARSHPKTGTSRVAAAPISSAKHIPTTVHRLCAGSCRRSAWRRTKSAPSTCFRQVILAPTHRWGLRTGKGTVEGFPPIGRSRPCAGSCKEFPPDARP